MSKEHKSPAAELKTLRKVIADADEQIRQTTLEAQRLKLEADRLQTVARQAQEENIRLRDAVHELELLVAHLRGRMHQAFEFGADPREVPQPPMLMPRAEFASAVPWTGSQQPWWRSR